MYQLCEIAEDHPALDQSPLVRALDFLNTKFKEHPNGIPLTKTRSFKRDFVAEAIHTIKWPDWDAERIYNGYMPIKHAQEYHFEPFCELHNHLVDLKLVRYYLSLIHI